MKNEFIGFYRGIVIQNNDPEQQGRVKVFVPEVNATVYDGWNNSDSDIAWNSIGQNVDSILNQNTKVFARLKAALPWAEMSHSIFGMSSAGYYDAAQDTATVENGPQNNDNSYNQRTKESYTELNNESAAPKPTDNIQKRTEGINGSTTQGVTSNGLPFSGTVWDEQIKPSGTVAEQIFELEVNRGSSSYFDANGTPKTFASYKSRNGSIYRDSSDPEYAGGLLKSSHSKGYADIAKLPDNQKERGIVNYIDGYTSGYYSNKNPGVDLAVRDTIWNRGGTGVRYSLDPFLRSKGYDVPPLNKNSPWTTGYKNIVDDAAEKYPDELITSLGTNRAARENGSSVVNRVATTTAAALDRNDSYASVSPLGGSIGENGPTGELFQDVSEDSVPNEPYYVDAEGNYIVNENYTGISPNDIVNSDEAETQGSSDVAFVAEDDIGHDKKEDAMFGVSKDSTSAATALGETSESTDVTGNNVMNPDTNPPMRGTAQTNKAKGIIGIPTTGSKVWVFFDNGDPNRPVVFAVIFGGEDYRGVFDSSLA